MDKVSPMLRFKAIAAIVLMVAASLCLPIGTASASGRDPNQVLMVDGDTVINETLTYKSVTIISTGNLLVTKTGILNVQSIKMKEGALKVDGGTINVGTAPDGGDALIYGGASSVELINGAHLVFRAPNGADDLDTSQGGDAGIDLRVSEMVKIKTATIECYGGTGFSKPDPWVDHTKLYGYYAAGGNGTVRLGSNLTTSTSVSDLSITMVGGNGGKAANGRNPTAVTGAKGGGYSNGGEVGDHVGAGGMGIISFGGDQLTVQNLVVSATGGRGGKAGDGGGLDADVTKTLGAGGGGGYSGGNGGDYTGTAAGEPGGVVTGAVGSGGIIDIDMNGHVTNIYGVSMTLTSGRGGDGGKGGTGSQYTGGGGGGYGGGGGSKYYAGNKGGDGTVLARVGGGGNISAYFLGETTLFASNISMTASAGQGGTGGQGGMGGGNTAYAGGGGGGGYGGGGGGDYYAGGGNGRVSGEVGMGGNISIMFAGGPMLVANSTLLLFGGQGGAGGSGGKGSYYGGGGGGGYGGGGGDGYGQPSSIAGVGIIDGFVGHGGAASVIFASPSNPGELVARSNKFYIMGGAGGDGGSGGPAGTMSGSGGGGYAGCGGRYYTGYSGTAPSVGKSIGSGGNAELSVYHLAPSISKLNAVSLIGGKAGNGKTQAGAGTGGGVGLGTKTNPGDQVPNLPMGVVVVNSPKPNEVVNFIAPTFEWEPIIYSSADGDVISYNIQVAGTEDFTAPAVDTGVELQTSFSPTSELSAGGVYYWRVMATYVDGNSYGYGPTNVFSFNTQPILKKNIPLHSFKEDVLAYHLINLTNYFSDDLFTDTLEYKIIYETDPSHILGMVDGNFLTFSTPTKDWNGQERFAVRAIDPLGLWWNSNNFTVRVTPVNDPPVLLSVPDIRVTEGEEHFFDLSPYVYDVDSRLTDMIVTTSSPYCRVSGLGLNFNYTPGLGIPDDRVAINISDGFDSTVTLLHLLIDKYNTPPRIVSANPWMLYLVEDTEYTQVLTDFGSDLETNATDLVWNVTVINAGNPPMFNAFIINRNTLKVIPAPDQNGQGSLVLVVIDKGGKEDSRTVTVNIQGVNDPPQIAHLPDMKLVAGTSIVVDLSKYITDVDNPLSELKVTTASALATVEGMRMTVFVKSESSENQDIIPISVSDGTDTATSEFLLRIVFPPSIPQLVPAIKTTTDKVKVLDLKEYVFDKDSPEAALNWEIVSMNEKYFTASIDPNTHILKITPKASGKSTMTLRVSDPDGGTASQVVQVSIVKEEKQMVIPTGIYVLIAFVVVAAVVGISLLAMRRKG